VLVRGGAAAAKGLGIGDLVLRSWLGKDDGPKPITKNQQTEHLAPPKPALAIFTSASILTVHFMDFLILSLTVLEVLVCLLLILIILMQRPRQEGLGAAFGEGVTNAAFGVHTTNVLQKGTGWLAAGLFIITVVLASLIAKKNSGTNADKLFTAPPAAAVAPAAPATPAPAAATTPTTAPVGAVKVTPPADAKPAAPALTKPAAPAVTKPAAPAVTKPAAPAVTKPAAPAVTKPADAPKPVTPAPAAPAAPNAATPAPVPAPALAPAATPEKK
jgi:preprotein translocase subunit SecG